MKSKLFVVSAPSGCGKTTLCKKLLRDRIGVTRSISVTTRPPRPGEKNGADYIFVSGNKFREMARNREFLEYEENFHHLYGTPKKFIKENLKKGKNLILSIDVKGAMKIRKYFPKKSTLIFLMPPSIAALKKRLETRMADSADSMSARLGLAKKEMAYKNKYDYVIVNDRLDRAYARLKKIVVSELKTK